MRSIRSHAPLPTASSMFPILCAPLLLAIAACGGAPPEEPSLGVRESAQIVDDPKPDVVVTVSIKACFGGDPTVVKGATVALWDQDTASGLPSTAITDPSGVAVFTDREFKPLRWMQSDSNVIAVIPPPDPIMSGNGTPQSYRTKIVRLLRGDLMAARVPANSTNQRIEVRVTLRPQLLCNGTRGPFPSYSRAIDSEDPGDPTLSYPTTSSAPNAPPPVDFVDLDADRLDDSIESWLANTWAPTWLIAGTESYKPGNVDWWLAQGAAERFRNQCGGSVSTLLRQSAPTGYSMPLDAYGSCSGETVHADGTRSTLKQRTFTLDTPVQQGGSSTTTDWKTYVHVYPNTNYAMRPNGGGISIQYWRLYAYDGGNGHPADWEGMQVHLGGDLGLGGGVRYSWIGNGIITITDAANVGPDGLLSTTLHAEAWITTGSHETTPARVSPGDVTAWQAWSDTGVVKQRWNGVSLGLSGGIVNIGEKLHPMADDRNWIKYSGLWGSSTGSFFSSGVYGPAYHDAQVRCSTNTTLDWDRDSGLGCNNDERINPYIYAWCGGDVAGSYYDGMDFDMVDGGKWANCVPHRWGTCTSSVPSGQPCCPDNATSACIFQP